MSIGKYILWTKGSHVSFDVVSLSRLRRHFLPIFAGIVSSSGNPFSYLPNAQIWHWPELLPSAFAEVTTSYSSIVGSLWSPLASPSVVRLLGPLALRAKLQFVQRLSGTQFQRSLLCSATLLLSSQTALLQIHFTQDYILLPLIDYMSSDSSLHIHRYDNMSRTYVHIDVCILIRKASWFVLAASWEISWAYGQGSTLSCLRICLTMCHGHTHL